MMMKTSDDKMAKASKAAAARSKLAPTKSQRPMSRDEGKAQAMLNMAARNAGSAPGKAPKPASNQSKLAPTKSQRPMSREEGRGQAMLNMAARNAGSAPGKGAKPSAPPKAPKPAAKGLAPSKSQRPVSRSSGKGMGKYAEGGMVRGCGSAMSGKKYSGTF